MAETKRVFLHIGAPKTGTTYLQAVLAHNRQLLRSRGVLYPATGADAHHTAAWDLRGTPAQRKDAKGIDGAWATMVARANAWSGHSVIVSTEMLVYCDEAQIARALDDFEAEVHVVYTARDLVRQVPAVWQERVKNQQTMTYRDFVGSVVEPGRSSGPHGFWRAQDAPAVLRRWSTGLDTTQVHIVTTPPAGQPRTVLLERFVGVLGLGTVDLATDLPAEANESLGLLQTELLRRYNERHGHDMSWPLYRRTIRLRLGAAFGAVRDDRKPALSSAERAYLVQRAATIVDELARAGYEIVGDLHDLIPEDEPSAHERGKGSTDHDVVSDAELLAAAVDVIHAVLSEQEHRRRGSRRRDELPADRPARGQ